jgi:hypothetical protein
LGRFFRFEGEGDFGLTNWLIVYAGKGRDRGRRGSARVREGKEAGKMERETGELVRMGRLVRSTIRKERPGKGRRRTGIVPHRQISMAESLLARDPSRRVEREKPLEQVERERIRLGVKVGKGDSRLDGEGSNVFLCLWRARDVER